MSLVKYHNKKLGRILVYEYTPHTDPVTNKSKPIRKYVGFEDPVTHVFTPSSGKPGRPQKKPIPIPSGQGDDEQALYASLYAEIESLKKTLASDAAKINILSEEKEILLKQVSDYKHIIDSIRNILGQNPS